MDFKWASIIGGFWAGWFFVKRWMDEISKIVEPLIKEVEKMALDGVIDKKERRVLVMKAISLLEQQGKIKLNFLSRMIISIIVDKIAKRLPDFKISTEAKAILAESKLLNENTKNTHPV